MCHALSRLSGLRSAVLVLAWAVLSVAAAVGQETHPRYIAAYGPVPEDTVWEPTIAAGPDGPVAIFNVGFRSKPQIGYAVYDVGQPNGWPEAVMTADGSRIDPSIAYDRHQGDFLAAGLGCTDIYVARITEGTAGEWTPIYDSIAVDKPWLVAGEVMALGQEYYVVAWAPEPTAGLVYRRSTDGGASWEGGLIYLNGDEQQPVVAPHFCAQPTAVAEADGALYIAYVRDNPDSVSPPEQASECQGARFLFLRGHDLPSGEVEFTQLLGLHGPLGPGEAGSLPPVPLSVSPTCGAIINFVARHRSPACYFGQMLDRVIPQLVTDASNPECMYLAYHDVRTDAQGQPTANVDVFVRRMTKLGSNWVVGEPIRVNPELDSESDQFLPAITVDTHGRIHVVYYDDRAYRVGPHPQVDGHPGIGDPDARFDVYYGVSDDQATTWTEKKLVWEADPSEPAVDLGIGTNYLACTFELGEYIGISSYTAPGGATSVWTAFTGSLSTDTSGDRSVIYYSQHTYQNP